MGKSYLFDFDGTLVDSMPTFIAVIHKILDDRGIKYDDGIVKTITPLGYLGTAEYYRSEFGIKDATDALIEEMNALALDAYARSIPAKAGVIDTLAELKARGADLNVLTASPHLTLDPCLKRLGIFDLFTNVWSCDDFKTTKANPDIYRMAAKKMNAQIESVIFVDDNPNAIKTARLAGMKAYGIYDASSEEYVDEMKQISDCYVTSFAELLYK